MSVQMLSNKSYLLRAFYDWIVDSECTPYIAVNAEMKGVDVPRQFVRDGKVVFNVSPMAVRDFEINNGELHFRAKFAGVEEQVYAPMRAILSVYAFENGAGMTFDEEDDEASPPVTKEPVSKKDSTKAKSHLHIVE
jgi:stringent starvation protein B